MTADGSAGSEFEAFCRRHRDAVESVLEALLPQPRPETPDERLAAAMRHAMFPGGKRLRPMLALLAATVTGGDPRRALRPAAALELLHTYSLVHDDLPCMDDDDLRRGRPSTHRAFDEATAVLAGDALLTLAFEVVAEAGAEAVAALARAAGFAGMVGGQAGDMAAEGGRGPRTLDAVRWVHDRKTAALVAGSLEVGARAGGGDARALPLLREFGTLLGRAFQIADDCLDVGGATDRLGKRTGQDAAAGKLTYPAVVGLAAAWQEAAATAAAAVEVGRRLCRERPGLALDWQRALVEDVARFAILRQT